MLGNQPPLSVLVPACLHGLCLRGCAQAVGERVWGYRHVKIGRAQGIVDVGEHLRQNGWASTLGTFPHDSCTLRIEPHGRSCSGKRRTHPHADTFSTQPLFWCGQSPKLRLGDPASSGSKPRRCGDRDSTLGRVAAARMPGSPPRSRSCASPSASRPAAPRWSPTAAGGRSLRVGGGLEAYLLRMEATRPPAPKSGSGTGRRPIASVRSRNGQRSRLGLAARAQGRAAWTLRDSSGLCVRGRARGGVDRNRVARQGVRARAR